MSLCFQLLVFYGVYVLNCLPVFYAKGTVSVNTTILKDGHVFGIHILNPLEGGEELPDPDIRPPMVVNVEDMGFERGRQEAEQEGKGRNPQALNTYVIGFLK